MLTGFSKEMLKKTTYYDVKTLIIFTYGSRLFLNRKKITTTLPLHIQQLTKCYNVFYTLQGPGEGSFFFCMKTKPAKWDIYFFSSDSIKT